MILDQAGGLLPDAILFTTVRPCISRLVFTIGCRKLTNGKHLGDIERVIRPGMVIPKPEAESGDYIVVEVWGKRRFGQDALIYSIPTKTEGKRRNRKGVTKSEWIQAAKHLTESGDFTRPWFEQQA